ncbi:uncharacterized protein ANIA_00857 [Aspergillus nidulans FGSC A4]|uniref:Rhodopsin domain-containing protein n=1 Tax=Emericella nidulans (strain FGSC A4 / ATCC 38163 / CBS 112.46 / NRRL 194 / M139) TaxID=227321 RepID=C8VQ13_EMENI|nr:hypothetical protein [Aspergillus nidulans FGSC A4]CBF88647.1 TPA: conserved hypothetical protein [Aspergillus nidulans FGSC A4]
MLHHDKMSSLGAEFGRSFARETWTLYAVGMLGVVLRFIARIRRLGIQNLQWDDYVMVFAVIWYTILCVALNEVASGGGSNLMTQEDIDNLTPEIYDERVKGSKWVFVSEHAFILAIWSMKTCMLIIYARITEGLPQRKWVNYLAIYVALGFIAVELSLFLICRPLSNYWAVPTPNPQCSTFQYYEIIQGCVAITADIAMLLIGLPLLMQVRVPLKQKLILVIIFGMGVFVIVAAILTKVYCLVPELISYVYMNWYFRETTVAILVTNLPLIWSLLRDVFPALKSWTGGSKRGTNRYRSGPWNSNPSGLKHFGTGTGTTHLRSGNEFPMHKYDRSVVVTPQKDMSEVSLEHTYSRGQSDDGSERALQIRQDVTIEVMRESRPPANYHLHDPQP